MADETPPRPTTPAVPRRSPLPIGRPVSDIGSSAVTRALHCAVAALAVVALLPGCSITAPRRASLMHAGTDGYCVSLEAAGGGPRASAADEAVEEVVQAGPDPAGGLSRTAAEIATIIGAGGLINRMDALEAQARRTGSPADPVQLLRLEQQVTQRVLRTMLDVAAVQANLDCENERGDQLRDVLLKLEDQWSRRMSQASILIGGTTAFVSGLLALLHPAAATGAVAGIGARLLSGSYYGQTVQIWAALLTAALMAAVLVTLVDVVDRAVRRRMGVRS